MSLRSHYQPDTPPPLFAPPLPAQHDNPVAIAAAVRSEPQRGTHAYAVLSRLLEGPATTADLCAITHRFSARVCDLRKLGHDITTEVQADGTAVFTLRSNA